MPTFEELEALYLGAKDDPSKLEGVIIKNKLDPKAEASALESARDEAARRRLENKELKGKLSARDEADKAALEAKLAEDGKVQELLDLKTTELASAKEAMKTQSEQLATFQEEKETRRKDLLSKLSDEHQVLLKDASESIIIAFTDKIDPKPEQKSDPGVDGLGGVLPSAIPDISQSPDELLNMTAEQRRLVVRKALEKNRANKFNQF